MKIVCVFVMSFLFTSFYGWAQEFNAGVYTGIVASQLDGDTYYGYNKAGLILGGYIDRDFNKKLAWKMGLRYLQKGSKQIDNKAGEYYKLQLHYMEIPLTIQLKYNKKVTIEGGASVGYLIKAMEDIDGYGLKEAEPPFKKYEVSSLIGVNYNFTKKIVAGTFFSYSITAVRPLVSGYENYMDKGQHNNLLYFTVGYKLSSWK